MIAINPNACTPASVAKGDSTETVPNALTPDNIAKTPNIKASQGLTETIKSFTSLGKAGSFR